MDTEREKGGPASFSIMSCRDLNLRMSLVIAHAVGRDLPENEATALGRSWATEKETEPGWQNLDPAGPKAILHHPLQTTQGNKFSFIVKLDLNFLNYNQASGLGHTSMSNAK